MSVSLSQALPNNFKMSCSKSVLTSPFFEDVNGHKLPFTFDEPDGLYTTRNTLEFSNVENTEGNIGTVVAAIKKYTTPENTIFLPNTDVYSCFYEMRETKDGIEYIFREYISSKGYMTYYKCVPREKFLDLYNKGSLADTSEFVERARVYGLV